MKTERNILIAPNALHFKVLTDRTANCDVAVKAFRKQQDGTEKDVSQIEVQHLVRKGLSFGIERHGEALTPFFVGKDGEKLVMSTHDALMKIFASRSGDVFFVGFNYRPGTSVQERKSDYIKFLGSFISTSCDLNVIHSGSAVYTIQDSEAASSIMFRPGFGDHEKMNECISQVLTPIGLGAERQSGKLATVYFRSGIETMTIRR